MIKINFNITERSNLEREVFDKSDLLISFAPSSPILFPYFDNKYKKMSIKYTK